MSTPRTIKQRGAFGLIKGVGKRLVLLLIVYLTVMVSLWTTLGQFFVDGVGFTWIFYVTLGLSVLALIALIVYVEYQQLKYYGN